MPCTCPLGDSFNRGGRKPQSRRQCSCGDAKISVPGSTLTRSGGLLRECLTNIAPHRAAERRTTGHSELAASPLQDSRYLSPATRLHTQIVKVCQLERCRAIWELVLDASARRPN